MSEVSKPHSELQEVARRVVDRPHTTESVELTLSEGVLDLYEQLEAVEHDRQHLRDLLACVWGNLAHQLEEPLLSQVSEALEQYRRRSLDDIDPRDLGDGMEATVEPGDEMTEAELDAHFPAKEPHA